MKEIKKEATFFACLMFLCLVLYLSAGILGFKGKAIEEILVVIGFGTSFFGFLKISKR